MVTHLCERAILLDHGRIQMNGPAAEVVSYYEAMCNKKPAGTRL
jgi:ABC-type polysaccharide/polyol phosphate transport system ATPase subunit